MLNHVGVLTIKVLNMEESVGFYTNILGFEVETKYGNSIVALKQESITIVLEIIDSIFEKPQPYVLPGIISNNLEEDIQSLKANGVKVLFEEPMPCPPGKFTIIEDPTGNQIEIIEFTS